MEPLLSMKTIYNIRDGDNKIEIKEWFSSGLQWLLTVTPPDGAGVVMARVKPHDLFTLVSPYTQAMMLAFLWRPEPKKVFMIGLGGGRLASVLLYYFGETVIDIAEISQPMLHAANRFGFELVKMALEERIRVFVADGREQLNAGVGRRYDVIMVDAFVDKEAMPEHLGSKDFYQLCEQRLSSGGCLTVNVLRADPNHQQWVNNMRAIFKHVYQCWVSLQNQVYFASMTPISIGDMMWIAREMQIKRRFTHNFREWISSINEVK